MLYGSYVKHRIYRTLFAFAEYIFVALAICLLFCTDMIIELAN